MSDNFLLGRFLVSSSELWIAAVCNELQGVSSAGQNRPASGSAGHLKIKRKLELAHFASRRSLAVTTHVLP